MTDTVRIPVEAYLLPETPSLPPEPPKRKRGRPKGSKNKPKEAPAPEAPAFEMVPEPAVELSVPDDSGVRERPKRPTITFEGREYFWEWATPSLVKPGQKPGRIVRLENPYLSTPGWVRYADYVPIEPPPKFLGHDKPRDRWREAIAWLNFAWMAGALFKACSAVLAGH